MGLLRMLWKRLLGNVCYGHIFFGVVSMETIVTIVAHSAVTVGVWYRSHFAAIIYFQLYSGICFIVPHPFESIWAQLSGGPNQAKFN